MTKNAFEIAENESMLPHQRVDALSEFFGHRGYGDRSQELQFVGVFFQQVFNKYPQLLSFEWKQYQDWKDQGLLFDLTDYKINENYNFGYYVGFENAPNYTIYDNQVKLNYELRSQTLDDEFDDFFMSTNEQERANGIEDYNRKYEELQTSLAPIRKPIDIILIFLKALYEHHRPYYFIYLFGRRALVKVTGVGITIENEDNNDWQEQYYDRELKT